MSSIQNSKSKLHNSRSKIATSQEEKLKELALEHYAPYKNLQTCTTHSLPKDYVCLNQKCEHFTVLCCKQCLSCVSSHHVSININKIVPKITQEILLQSKSIEEHNKDIENQWKRCSINIQYCIDILNDIKNKIQEKCKKITIKTFTSIVAQLYSMFRHQSTNGNAQHFLKNFLAFNLKYQLFQKDFKDHVSTQLIEKEKEATILQVKMVNQRTKKFSQKSLVFSELLAEIIEDKIKMQTKIIKLDNSESIKDKIVNLKDLFTKNIEEISKINNIKIQIGSTGKQKQQFQWQRIAKQCKNLQSLHISSSMAHSKHNLNSLGSYKKLIQQFELFKYLTELRLHLNSHDLGTFLKIFKERPNSSRMIDKLHLQINDEKQLNIIEVYEFCNLFQLKHLSVNICRNSLSKKLILDLFANIKIRTSMTNLLLKVFQLNASKNKIHENQQKEVELFFMKKCEGIKGKAIIL